LMGMCEVPATRIRSNPHPVPAVRAAANPRGCASRCQPVVLVNRPPSAWAQTPDHHYSNPGSVCAPCRLKSTSAGSGDVHLQSGHLEQPRNGTPEALLTRSTRSAPQTGHGRMKKSAMGESFEAANPAKHPYQPVVPGQAIPSGRQPTQWCISYLYAAEIAHRRICGRGTTGHNLHHPILVILMAYRSIAPLSTLRAR
jgi:hypothetical protein